MVRKKLIYAITILAIIIFTITFLLFMLIPDERYSIIQPVKYSSMEEYKKFKLQDSFNKVLDNNEKALTITVDEDELNEILAIQYKDIREKSVGIPDITGFKGQITDGEIKIFVDSQVLGFIPCQYSFEVIPSIESNSIVFFMSRARVGQIPLPKKLVLNKIRKSMNDSISVDIDKGKIIFNTKLAKQFAYRSIEIKDRKIELHVGIFIQSMDDLMQILSKIFPNGLKDIIDKIPIDTLIKEGASLLKDMTLKKINMVTKSVKSEVINDTLKSLTSSESINKINDMLKGTTLEVLKEDADKALKTLNKVNENDTADNSPLRDRIVDAVKDKLSSESINTKFNILKDIIKYEKQD